MHRFAARAFGPGAAKKITDDAKYHQEKEKRVLLGSKNPGQWYPRGFFAVCRRLFG